MSTKLGMEHYVLKLYKVYISDDPELTLTHFTTLSNLGEIVFGTYSRPRYQVSIYRTNGPLVFIMCPSLTAEKCHALMPQINGRKRTQLPCSVLTVFSIVL